MAVVERRLHDRKELWFPYLVCKISVVCMEPASWKIISGMISLQVPTSLCMQNKLITHSRYCFVEQYVYPREPNIYMGNLYLRDE